MLINFIQTLTTTNSCRFLYKFIYSPLENNTKKQTYLYRIGDIWIRFSAARVILDIAFCVQSYQRPFVVRDIIGQIAVHANLV